MTKLLPNTNQTKENNHTRGEGDLNCVIMRQKNSTLINTGERNGNTRMISSQTSDLTASITSNDLNLRGFDSPTICYRQPRASTVRSEGTIGYEGTDDYDELDRDLDSGGGGSNNGGFSETDTLLLRTKKVSHILNLTHIEDNDICFADE